MSWKPKKWDEEMGSWKMTGMVLCLLVSVIAFLAGKSAESMTGQSISNNHGLIVMLGICAVMGFLIGAEYRKMAP